MACFQIWRLARSRFSPRGPAAPRTSKSLVLVVILAFPFVAFQLGVLAGVTGAGGRCGTWGQGRGPIGREGVGVREMRELVGDIAKSRLELRTRQDDDGEGDGRQQHHEKCIFDEGLSLAVAASL